MDNITINNELTERMNLSLSKRNNCFYFFNGCIFEAEANTYHVTFGKYKRNFKHIEKCIFLVDFDIERNKLIPNIPGMDLIDDMHLVAFQAQKNEDKIKHMENIGLIYNLQIIKF